MLSILQQWVVVKSVTKMSHYHSNVTCIGCISFISTIWMVTIDIVSDPDTKSTSATRTSTHGCVLCGCSIALRWAVLCDVH